MTYGQVWWPILGICALHLTHPSAHTQQWTHTHTHTHTPWTHTWSSGQAFCCGTRGAVGGSVPCSRVSPQSWYWGWREHCTFTPPTYNSCWYRDSNSQPFDYESDSLTIRPRLPPLRMGVSSVPCYCFCTPYGYSWDKNAPHVYELIVENINYLWLLLIYDILVHKQTKYHFISASSFCVVMKKAESFSTVLSLPYYYWLEIFMRLIEISEKVCLQIKHPYFHSEEDIHHKSTNIFRRGKRFTAN